MFSNATTPCPAASGTGRPPSSLAASIFTSPFFAFNVNNQLGVDGYRGPRGRGMARGAAALGLMLTFDTDFDRGKLNKMDDATQYRYSESKT